MLARYLILIFQARSSCCCAAGLGTDAARVKPEWWGFGFSVYRIQTSPQQQQRCGSQLRRERKGNSSRRNADEWMKMARGNVERVKLLI